MRGLDYESLKLRLQEHDDAAKKVLSLLVKKDLDKEVTERYLNDPLFHAAAQLALQEHDKVLQLERVIETLEDFIEDTTFHSRTGVPNNL